MKHNSMWKSHIFQKMLLPQFTQWTKQVRNNCINSDITGHILMQCSPGAETTATTMMHVRVAPDQQHFR